MKPWRYRTWGKVECPKCGGKMTRGAKTCLGCMDFPSYKRTAEHNAMMSERIRAACAAKRSERRTA